MSFAIWWHSLNESERAEWASAIATTSAIIVGVATVVIGGIKERCRASNARRISMEFQTIPLRLVLRRVTARIEEFRDQVSEKSMHTVSDQFGYRWGFDTTNLLHGAVTDISAFPNDLAREIATLQALCAEINREIDACLSAAAGAALLVWPEGGPGERVMRALKVARSLSAKLDAAVPP